MTEDFNQNDLTKTPLTKDNLLPSVLKWCAEHDADIEAMNIKPWDPTGAFHKQYSNRQIEIGFKGNPTGYGVSIINNSFAYGIGFEVALTKGVFKGLTYIRDEDCEFFEDVEVPYHVGDLYEILEFVRKFSLSGSSLDSVEPDISGQ